EVLLFELEARSELLVVRVGVRDNGVERVVTAVELDDDQDALVLGGLGGPRGPRDKQRHRRGQGEQGRRLQEPATREHGWVSRAFDGARRVSEGNRAPSLTRRAPSEWFSH